MKWGESAPRNGVAMKDLRSLQAELPLPGAWSASQVVRHTTLVGELAIELAGLSCQARDGTAVTAGAGCHGGDPLPRAYYELVERVGILEARGRATDRLAVRDSLGDELRRGEARQWLQKAEVSSSWQPSKSNGVALGPTWQFAARRAAWELCERDQVLRSWYGAVTPKRLDVQELLPAGLESFYELQAYRLDGGGSVCVAAVICWPREEHRPLVLGYGARPATRDAVRAARDECLQRVGFLWKEDLPETMPEPVPTPDFHQDYYLWPGSHGALRRWLAGDHVGLCPEIRAMPARSIDTVEYVDLTPEVLRGRAHLALALRDEELILGFGVGHPAIATLPPELRVHPVA